MLNFKNWIDGKTVCKLEKILEQQSKKNNGSSLVPAISIERMEYRTTYKNGKLGVEISVNVREDKVSPDELQELKSLLYPENVTPPEVRVKETPSEYSGGAC